jgi:hypothetical protein
VDEPPNRTIVLSLDEREGDRGWLHRWAGVELWCARRIAAEAEPADRPAPPAADDAQTGALIAELDEPALAAPRAVLRTSRGYRVEYDDECFFVAESGAAIARARRSSAPESRALTLERLFGAPLALALARRGTYLLHASAVTHGRGALALAAASGGGKSTLAAAAAARGAPWRRLADDLLPARFESAPLALPRYPQLKLDSAATDEREIPEALPLAAVVELDRGDEGALLALEELAPAAAAMALARATVAARLFDRELLSAHLAACARAAERVRVARLGYPTGRARLDAVLDLLADRFD